MRFSDIRRIFSDQPWFDFEMVRAISGEQPDCLRTELYRWRKSGKLTELRRGFFTLRKPVPARGGPSAGDFGAVLAAPLYSPSYLSGAWALRFWGAMKSQAPAAAPEYTSVTSRPPAQFENSFGLYRYDTLPVELHFGIREAEMGGHKIRVAGPEKAFLDLCFVEGCEWDGDRIASLGLDAEFFDMDALASLARRTHRPRLIRAAKTLAKLSPAAKGKSADSGAESDVERIGENSPVKLFATALRSLHESQALTALAFQAGTGREQSMLFDFGLPIGNITLCDFITLCDIDSAGLEFSLLSKKGYKPESWLFAMRRKFRFMGVSARIAFARRGDIHSGWIKFPGLAREDARRPPDIRVTIHAKPLPEGLKTHVARLVEHEGERFAVLILKSPPSGCDPVAPDRREV